MHRKIILLIFSLVFSCGYSPKIDNAANLTRKDVRDALVKKKRGREIKYNPKNSPSKLNLSKLLIAPPPPSIGSGKLISFSVTEEVPLKDVLIELARVADIDIEIDPKIEGGIILKATKKPLKVIIERICELGKLRYSYENNILRFEQDTPYSISYNVNYLIDSPLWESVKSSVQEIIKNDGEEAKIDVNKDASIMTVFASSKSQETVKRYFTQANRNASAQVLIEAKVVEVNLKDEYRAGINWDFQDGTASDTTTRSSGFATIGGAGVDGNISNALLGGSLSATISALETFGFTRALSSPRAHAINNQKATLNFTNSVVYFNIEKNSTTTASDTPVTNDNTTSTKEEVDVGVTLDITPSINLETNEVTLTVNPELKVLNGFVDDPVTTGNKVPQVQTRKMNTTLKVKSGGIMVIGGLMSETASNTDNGIPLLSKIPLLGHFFKSASRSSDITETVIFIKATIVNSDGKLRESDKDFYDKFSTERTPLYDNKYTQ